MPAATDTTPTDRSIARTVEAWAAWGAVAVVLAAVCELALLLVVAPIAASDGLGLVHVVVTLLAIHALGLVAPCFLGMLLERFIQRYELPSSTTLVSLAVLFGLSVASVRIVDHVIALATPEYPARLELLHVAATLVVLMMCFVATHTIVRPSIGCLFRVLPGLDRPRWILALGLLVGGWSAIGLVYFSLAPIQLDELAPWATLGALALLLSVARSVVPRPPRSAGRVAIVATSIVVVVGLLVSYRDRPTRFVALTHAFAGGSLARSLDRALDFDGDGSSAAWLVGTDCAELDASRGVAWVEVAGDGVDQDCRGGDARPAAPPAKAVAAWPGCRLPEEPLSVLLVTIDALRADRVSDELTPHLARLGKRSITFSRAYSPATLTKASMLSVLTGRPVRDLADGNVVATKELDFGTTFARRLQEAGWATAAVNYFDFPQAGYDGFDRVNVPQRTDQHGATVKGDFNSAGIANHGIDLLRAFAGRRFFLWLHFPDAHAPYLPTNDTKFSDSVHPYDRELAYVDFHSGRVLGALQKSGLIRSTIVTITADHGEDLGARGREGHGPLLYEESIRVPLIIWIPGCAPRRLAHPVSLSALAPSLGRLLGVELGGASLLGNASDGPVVAESVLTKLPGLRRAIIADEHKLVVDVTGGGRALFDLERDPLERRNLYRTAPDVAERMERLYQAWLDRGGA